MKNNINIQIYHKSFLLLPSYDILTTLLLLWVSIMNMSAIPVKTRISFCVVFAFEAIKAIMRESAINGKYGSSATIVPTC